MSINEDYAGRESSQHRANSNEISVPEILDILRMRWKLILISTLVFGAVSIGVTFLLTPTYRGEVLLIPADTNLDGKNRLGGLASQLGELASFAGVSSTSTSKDEAIAILQSRALTDRFLTENNLLPILFDKKWDEGNKRWKTDDPTKVPTLWDAYKKITRIRKVTEDLKTGLVTITVDWKDAALAASWANDLVSRTNQYMRSKALSHSAANVDYLKTQLDRTSVVEIRNSINSLIEDELKKSMLASGTDEYAFKIIDPAVTPQDRNFPRSSLFLAGGLALGLLIGILGAFARGRS